MDIPPDPVAHRVAGCLLLVTSLVAVVWGLGLQFHIENTDVANYETSVGKALLGIAWLGLPGAITAIVSRRRDVGVTAAALGFLLLGFAALQARADLHPEAREREVTAAFAVPAGVATEVDYDFPTLRTEWTVPSDDEHAVCEQVEAAMRDWSDRTVHESPHDECWFAGGRDGHDGTVFVRPAHDGVAEVEVVLSVTRRV